MSERPPSSTLFPYTTLFRSDPVGLHGRVRMGRPPHRARHVACVREERGAEHVGPRPHLALAPGPGDRKSTRLNSSHANISYAVFCLKKKNKQQPQNTT